jgi:hypothetical protein
MIMDDHDSSRLVVRAMLGAQSVVDLKQSPRAERLEYCDIRPLASEFDKIKRYARRLTHDLRVRSSFRFSK